MEATSGIENFEKSLRNFNFDDSQAIVSRKPPASAATTTRPNMSPQKRAGPDAGIHTSAPSASAPFGNGVGGTGASFNGTGASGSSDDETKKYLMKIKVRSKHSIHHIIFCALHVSQFTLTASAHVYSFISINRDFFAAHADEEGGGTHRPSGKR